MDWLEALILGLIQGLTEFLPVSSSGHLELGKALLGVEMADNVLFTVVVHGATVLSTIVIFWRDILDLFKGLLSFRWNEETKYLAKIAISMIPVGIIGVFFKDFIESIFNNKDYIILVVGASLIVTACLLAFTNYAKRKGSNVGFGSAFIIGIAQAMAVLPGISRSGATIATGILLGIRKKHIAKFSFLMVLIPILGENVLDFTSGKMTASLDSSTMLALVVGFVSAFISGLFACKWMIGIVKKGKLVYFAIYCFIIGLISISTFMFTAV
ncbi:MAG: UDP-diphosphatase [Marinilabiliales bacterium]|nr:MAG: UDP-diphosphatase [Marinilabiliales bacterium]